MSFQKTISIYLRRARRKVCDAYFAGGKVCDAFTNERTAFAVLFLLCIAMQAFFSYNDRIKTILEDTTMKVSVIQMNMRSLESKANFDRAGACIAEYDKTHPFTPMGEHEVYTPGDHLVTFTLDSVRCGLLICYEVRFPELWRTLALRGAQVMFLPAQWTAARQYHWETLTAARAIENQLFVVSCNACGERDGTLYGGFSRILDPLGAVLAQGGGEEEIVTADLDLSSIAPLRKAVPVFHDRRPELYRL